MSSIWPSASGLSVTGLGVSVNQSCNERLWKRTVGNADEKQVRAFWGLVEILKMQKK
jgi:hypothetical protein